MQISTFSVKASYQALVLSPGVKAKKRKQLQVFHVVKHFQRYEFSNQTNNT